MTRRPSHSRGGTPQRAQRVAQGAPLPVHPKFTLLEGSGASPLDSGPLPGPGSQPAPGSARAYLMRICEGDPLGLATAVRERMAERALLVEPARVGDKTAARAAFEMARDGSWQDEPARVREWIDRALALELEDQRAAGAEPVPRSPGPFLAAVAERLGLEPLLMNEAVVVFNGLPTRVRRVFFGAFVRGESLEQLAATGHGPVDTVRRRLRCALLSIARLRPSELAPEDGSSTDD